MLSAKMTADDFAKRFPLDSIEALSGNRVGCEQLPRLGQNFLRRYLLQTLIIPVARRGAVIVGRQAG